MVDFRTRLFQQWFRFRRPLTLGVRAIVENSDGHIALIRHTYVPGWHFPGGGVERAETAHVALSRELVEEVGVELTGIPHLLGVYSNHFKFPNDHVLLYHVPVSCWTGCKATSIGEIAEVRWVAPSELPEGVTGATAQRVQEHFENVPRDAYWVRSTT